MLPRRILVGLVVMILAPSILAAGFGVWTTASAWQQHLALDLMLELLLRFETWDFRNQWTGDGGLIGPREPYLVLAAAMVVALVLALDRFLPRFLHPPFDVVECAPAALGLIAGTSLAAVGIALDRRLFWGGVVVAIGAGIALASTRPPSQEPGGWRAKSNIPARAAMLLAAVGVAYYAVTSLWEGATYTNPLFRPAARWIAGPGAGGMSAGGLWLCIGALASLPAWISALRRHRAWSSGGRTTGWWLIALGVVGTSLAEWFWTPSGSMRTASLLSAWGGLVLAGGLGAWAYGRRFAPRSVIAVLDPRAALVRGAPFFIFTAFCLARGLTVQMWTAPETLPYGVEQLAGPACVFGISVNPADDAVYYTDRCRIEVGRIDDDGVTTWDLTQRGVHGVEELGDPADGTLWAAVSAYTEEANLVLLAVEGEQGPRTVDGALGITPSGERHADRPGIPLPDCWAASWIEVPPTAPEDYGAETEPGDVLVGCEDHPGGRLLRPGERRVVRDVQLGSRVEGGTFDATGERLFGVALWRDPYLRSWKWPWVKPLEARVLGAFNWDVEFVPDEAGGSLWIPRFIEGSMLVFDPNDLSLRETIPLSFGIRAVHYDPVHDRVWAAAAYTGRLWSIEAKPPHRRTAYALCGQTRDLATDAKGRVVVPTDCGIYRIDPTQ